MNTSELLSYLDVYFNYDKETGHIERTDRKNSNGSKDKDGYLIIKIKGKQYKAHRLAWLIVYREWPQDEIDHINRDRTDNRINNLRVVDRCGNINNTTKKINKDTGCYGIYIDRTRGLKKKYAFRHNNKMHRFYTLEDAIMAKGEII